MIQIGSDPEFELRSKSGFERCDQAYNDTAPREVFHKRAHFSMGSFGTDGCSNTGEMRPHQGTPAEHTKNIGELLKAINEAISRNKQVFAGSGIQVPLGGHIHFSSTPNTVELRSALDIVITEYLRTVSTPKSLAMRDRCGYGANGSYRPNNWGWEYRAPLSWIAHPIIARGVLESAYQLAKLHTDMFIQSYDKGSREFLKLFTKPTDILSICEDSAGPILEKYFDFIDEMKREGLFIEDIEVLQAWKIRSKRIVENTGADANETLINTIGPIISIDDVAGAHTASLAHMASFYNNLLPRLCTNRLFNTVVNHTSTENVLIGLSPTQEEEILLLNIPNSPTITRNFRVTRDRRHIGLVDLVQGYTSLRHAHNYVHTTSDLADEITTRYARDYSGRPSITLNTSFFNRQDWLDCLKLILLSIMNEHFSFTWTPHIPRIENNIDTVEKVSKFLSYKPKSEARRKAICVV